MSRISFDRWRGTNGVMGWITLRWDVWQIRRFANRLKRADDWAKQNPPDDIVMSESWRREQVYRDGVSQND